MSDRTPRPAAHDGGNDGTPLTRSDGGTADSTATRATDAGLSPSLSVLDRALYALFSTHADSHRHEADRYRYRGTDLRVGFDVFLARTYGLSWVVAGTAFVAAFTLVLALPPATLDAVVGFFRDGVPGLARVGVPALPRSVVAATFAAVVAGGGKRGVVAFGGLYLRWVTAARRADIERTLPGAARYLRALASGSDDRRAMLRKVADNDAYGETAVSIRKALNTAALTGSVDEGLRRVARDTPSRDALAPFLLKFREHAAQGEDALASYLEMESRMLGHRQARARQRAEGFLEIVAELFIVLLVLPALLVIVLTVMSVLAPGLSAPAPGPIPLTVREVLVYGSASFVLLVGVAAALTVDSLRPPDQRVSYGRPDGPLALLASTPTNPASAAVVLAPLGLTVCGALSWAGYHPFNAVLLGYVAYAVPVGLVALRRARRDDAKDREITDFVHAVSGHVSLGRPFPEAVEHVSRDVDLGPLNDDVAGLAFNLRTTTYTGDDGDHDVRRVALSRFLDRVGTPLAEQSIGLVTSALDAGSETEAVFETLQTEIGRLYHEKRALRSNMLVYVAVGWTTALLVIGITVAVNSYVLDGFAQLSSLSGSSGFALNPRAIQPERDAFRFYVVTQSTMLASGWFAGAASRGAYEALLHSGALVAVCYLLFAGVGMI